MLMGSELMILMECRRRLTYSADGCPVVGYVCVRPRNSASKVTSLSESGDWGTDILPRDPLNPDKKGGKYFKSRRALWLFLLLQDGTTVMLSMQLSSSVVTCLSTISRIHASAC